MEKIEPLQASVLNFPCRFPIKVIGEISADVEVLVRDTLEKHLCNTKNLDIKIRTSRAGNFVSITATFTAENQVELDTIYTIFSQHEKVRYVL